MEGARLFSSPPLAEQAIPLLRAVAKSSLKELEQVDATIQNLVQLKKLIPIEDQLLRDLETLRKELLESGTPQKAKRKEIVKKIKKAIAEWEGLLPRIQENPAWVKELGNKQARLLELKNIHQEGVEHPASYPIKSSTVQAFLEQHAPRVGQLWRELGGQYHPAFLKQPEVQQKLQEIQAEIGKAFAEKPFSLPEGLLTHDGYFMIRSSGAEDTRQCPNAGGNKSIPYVAAKSEELCQAIGEVVASYFSHGSLQNRLNGGENPFDSPLSLAVIAHELIGEPVGGETDPKKIPASVVLFTNEPTYVGDEPFRVMRLSVVWGHGEGAVGAAGIESDTILLMRSLKHPDRLYVLENNQLKPKRLAPVREADGKVILQALDNPKELAERAALDPELLTRLFYYGIAVEKAFGGHPQDMELVIKEEKSTLSRHGTSGGPLPIPAIWI